MDIVTLIFVFMGLVICIGVLVITFLLGIYVGLHNISQMEMENDHTDR